jgi:hypothetical protein
MVSVDIIFQLLAYRPLWSTLVRVPDCMAG